MVGFVRSGFQVHQGWIRQERVLQDAAISQLASCKIKLPMALISAGVGGVIVLKKKEKSSREIIMESQKDQKIGLTVLFR